MAHVMMQQVRACPTAVRRSRAAHHEIVDVRRDISYCVGSLGNEAKQPFREAE
jgi:hypothetical protein